MLYPDTVGSAMGPPNLNAPTNMPGGTDGHTGRSGGPHGPALCDDIKYIYPARPLGARLQNSALAADPTPRVQQRARMGDCPQKLEGSSVPAMQNLVLEPGVC